MPNPSTVGMDIEAEEAKANHALGDRPEHRIDGADVGAITYGPPVEPSTTAPLPKQHPYSYPELFKSLKSEEVRVVDEKTGGAKGQKDAWLSLVPPRFKNYLSQVYRFGAKKYTRDNYLRGYNWSLSYDAMQRHIDATLEGEWLDEESGLPHLAHAAWHCATLILFHDYGIGTDDRIDFTGQNFLPDEVNTPDADETVLKGRSSGITVSDTVVS